MNIIPAAIESCAKYQKALRANFLLSNGKVLFINFRLEGITWHCLLLWEESDAQYRTHSVWFISAVVDGSWRFAIDLQLFLTEFLCYPGARVVSYCRWLNPEGLFITRAIVGLFLISRRLMQILRYSGLMLNNYAMNFWLTSSYILFDRIEQCVDRCISTYMTRATYIVLLAISDRHFKLNHE